MKTGWENQKTETLQFVRERMVAGVWDIGKKVAEDKHVNGEAKVMVHIQLAWVEQIDAELMKRGFVVPAPPWE